MPPNVLFSDALLVVQTALRAPFGAGTGAREMRCFGQEDGGWTSLGSNGWRLDDLMVA